MSITIEGWARFMSTVNPDSKQETTICVDRSAPLAYPDWTVRVLHPELERRGPKEYDIASINLWFHDDQKRNGRVIGRRIYERFKEFDEPKPWYGLLSCLGFHDALVIQNKGYNWFGDVFGPERGIFFFKSVVEGSGGKVFVPWVHRYSEGGLIGDFGVKLEWRCIDEEFYYYDFAAQFQPHQLPDCY